MAYALLLSLIGVLAPLILQTNVFQVFQVQQFFSRDLELNDLYYRLGSWEDEPRAREVVVINTEGLAAKGQRDKFREEFVHLIRNLDNKGPSVIGVDLLFGQSKNSETDNPDRVEENLRKVIESTPRVVVASKMGGEAKHLNFNQESGIVNFPVPGRVSIRTYQRAFGTDTERQLSFAAALVELHRPGVLDAQQVPKAFPLRYGKEASLITVIREGDKGRYSGRRTKGIPVIDAKAFLQAPDSFDVWIRDAMVVIGHVSRDENDIEDKFRVPCDTILVSRLPTVSGPVIHAIAADNMLHYSSRGWRYVPEWLRSFAAIAMLISLIHLLLHTRFGKAANFVVLALATIPLIYIGFLLMSWGYYWPMNSTLLPFIFIEEIMEFLVPIVTRVVAFLRQKVKWRGAATVLLLIPMVTHGQSIEVLMLQGGAQFRGLDYSPDRYDSFVVHPGDTAVFAGGSQVMLLDIETEKSTIYVEGGRKDWGALKTLIFNDMPSLGAEVIRLFLVEDLANASLEENVGAATRGGDGWKVFPTDGSTVVADSVWVGFDPEEVLPPMLEFSIWNEEGAEVGSWSEPGLAGVWWSPTSRPATFDVRVTLSGTPWIEWEFRVEAATALGRRDRLRKAMLTQCTGCDPEMLETLRSAWGLDRE